VGVPSVKLEMRPWRRRTEVMARDDVEYGSDVDARADWDVLTRCAHKRCGRVGSLADMAAIQVVVVVVADAGSLLTRLIDSR
jgi:hypothetical protein